MTNSTKRNGIGIVLIGAGNLATNLGVALQQKGYDIRQIYSRTQDSAQMLGKRLSVGYTTDLSDVCRDADLYIVALKDSALKELIPEITSIRKDALYVHTAGSMPMNVWKGYASRYGVFYPMQTFSKLRLTDFGNIPLFLEAGNEADLKILHEVAENLSLSVHELSSEQRRYLHLAAVFACNFTNHLYALTAELLAEHDISFQVMLPLIDETVAKVHQLAPRDAQTGPAVRYDVNVIEKHMELLASHPEMQELYRLLSESICHLNNNKRREKKI